MITLTKGSDTKFLSKESGLVEILLKQGWSLPEEAKLETKPEEKDIVKNGKPSKPSN